MEKMQSLLSDPESMQQLQELAQMLQPDTGEKEAGETPPGRYSGISRGEQQWF